MRKRQTDAVLEHLKEKGSITSIEAFSLYGVTRLSAIIYILRNNENLTITSVRKVTKNRYGNNTAYAEYKLIKE